MAFVEHVCICGFMNLQDRFQDISLYLQHEP